MSCSSGDTAPEAVATVVVAPATATVIAGSTIQFTASTLGARGIALNGRSVAWASSNSSIASVSTNGLVTGVAAGGPVTITATSEGKSGSAALTVNPPPVASVEISPNAGSLIVGATVQLLATPRDAAGATLAGRVVTWSSSNPALATVSATGLVTGVSAGGPMTITAASEGKTGAFSLTVLPPPVASVTVTPSSGTIVTGGTLQLTATPKDVNGAVLSGRAVTWTSGSSAVVTVSAFGLLTGVSRGGPITIIATIEGQDGTASITVIIPAVASVTVAPSSSSLSSGQSVQLTATLRDASGNVITGRGVGWSAGNPAVAAVSTNGLVTGVAAGGPVTITATSEGKSGTASITVTAPNPCAVATLPTIAIGQTITAALSTGDCLQTTGEWSDGYLLSIGSSTTVRIAMSSGVIDTFLGLAAVVNGTLIPVASDDDGGDGSNSQIVRTLGAGTWLIVATSFDPGEVGAYSLSVTQVATIRADSMSPAPANTRIATAMNELRLFLRRAKP